MDQAKYEALIARLSEAEVKQGRLPLLPLPVPLAASKSKSARPAPNPKTHSLNVTRQELLVPRARGGLRLIDALMVMAAAGEVFWPATRQTVAAQLGWSAFGALFGGFVYFESNPGSELNAVGAALTASNTAYLMLRIIHPNLSQG